MTATVASYPLPDAALVRELLGMLFDGLTVKPGAKLDVSPKSGAYFGVYVADDGSPAVLCACDIVFAANSSAALSMLPPNAAAGAVKAKLLTDMMIANLREVMNICTRLVIRDGTPHLKLAELGQFAALPPAAAAITTTAKGRVDFEIGIGEVWFGCDRGTIALDKPTRPRCRSKFARSSASLGADRRVLPGRGYPPGATRLGLPAWGLSPVRDGVGA